MEASPTSFSRELLDEMLREARRGKGRKRPFLRCLDFHGEKRIGILFLVVEFKGGT